MATRAFDSFLPRSYATRREAVAAHFEESADRWASLTSAAPLGRIRETVREGRTEMREILLSWLPRDLTGMRVLDAGCGPGGLALELAERGADVLGIDVSPALIRVARDRAPERLPRGSVEFRTGDMLDDAWGTFDHVVAMDSLIHYPGDETLAALGALMRRTRRSIVFTYAPRTPLLAVMHGVGSLLPASSRAPRIQPMPARRILRALETDPRLADASAGRTARVSCGFYISQGLELRLEAGPEGGAP